MSPMGSLKKCLFRKGDIEMKRHLSDTICIRSDFQGEGIALHGRSHPCGNVSPVGGPLVAPGIRLLRIAPLGIFLGLEGLCKRMS